MQSDRRRASPHPILIALTAVLTISAFVFFAHAKGILWGAVKNFYSLYKGIEWTETHFSSKWGIASLALVVIAVGTIGLAQIVPYTPSGVAHMHLEIADARDKIRYEHNFTVAQERSHTIILNVSGQGFLTGLRISNEEGSQILGTYGETIFSVMGITLAPGDYTISIYFMTSWDDVRAFYYTGDAHEYLVDDKEHSSYEIFANTNDDYSVTVSVVIR